MEKEIWKAITGYEGLYEVSSLGRVKSLGRKIPVEDRFERSIGERILKQAKTVGYPVVALRKDNKARTHYVHRLVANAFIPNLENKPQVNHKDGIKENNLAKNLEWVTVEENAVHAFKNNLCPKPDANKNGNFQGEKIPSSKLKDEEVLFIRENSKKNGGKFSNIELAKRFQISASNVCLILKETRWKHIKTFNKEEIK